MNQPYILLSALIAWISISSALADSTDGALIQFYTENMISRLTSDVSTEVSNALPENQKATKDPAAFENLRKTSYQVFLVRPSFFHEATSKME
jgi:hypothetical protein